MRFIKFVYEQDLEAVDPIDLSQQGLMNTLKGKFLEMVVEVTMMKFNHELRPGAWFGQTGQVEVPLFSVVKTTTVKASPKPRLIRLMCSAKKKSVIKSGFVSANIPKPQWI
jgi:hypothetical protein